MRLITEDERALLAHVTRWGSDGYPIQRYTRNGAARGSRRGWSWGGFRSIQGPPTVWRTKREAVASFEAFLDVLHEALRDERTRAAQVLYVGVKWRAARESREEC